jgi:hypothetical protein
MSRVYALESPGYTTYKYHLTSLAPFHNHVSEAGTGGESCVCIETESSIYKAFPQFMFARKQKWTPGVEVDVVPAKWGKNKTFIYHGGQAGVFLDSLARGFWPNVARREQEFGIGWYFTKSWELAHAYARPG